MLLTLISAKGAPGVTTAAVALAAVGAEERARRDEVQTVDVVELDPSGGDIESLTGVVGEPGLLRSVADLSSVSLAENSVEAPPGIRSVLAPMSGFEATATIDAGLGRWSTVLAELGGTVVIDAGRWDPTQILAGRIEGSTVVAVVCRPDSRGVEHARRLIERSRPPGLAMVLVTIGDSPYALDEITSSVGIRGGGTLAWDPGGASALWTDGITTSRRALRSWTRSWLARSARDVLAELMRIAEAVPAP